MAEGKSFGIREEHRMTMGLLFQISAQISTRSLDTEWHKVECKKTSFFAYPTKDVLNFLWGNISKFAFAFKYSLVKEPNHTISVEATKMAMMFLYFLYIYYRGFYIQID